MKVIQTKKHLGESVALGAVLVVMSLAFIALMTFHSGVFQ